MLPPRDAPMVSDAISKAVRGPDYMRTNDGSAPVFFLVNSATPWLKGLGGEDSAKQPSKTSGIVSRPRRAKSLSGRLCSSTCQKQAPSLQDRI